ncbi:hypothetical protein C8Q77DRAFT_1216975 [Trametes polyzona]|nr:hypothetical protein C8Q77DRAFT_1216975 [Trametes polyzona]
MSDIWPMYLEHAITEDKEMVLAWNTDLDTILIFAALFSAVLTTFIVESYQTLQADPQTAVLYAILNELQAVRNGTDAPASAVQQFQAAASSIRVNIYWFSSLIISLATALIAILAKQWVNYLLAGLSPVPAMRARHRQYRIDGMQRWNLPAVLSFLPILLHVALLLFFAGLVEFILDLNRVVATISAVLVCLTAAIYLVANLLAIPASLLWLREAPSYISGVLPCSGSRAGIAAAARAPRLWTATSP